MAKYLLLSLTLFATACTTSQPIATHTSLPPTLTSMPPTYTSLPPTHTSLPPTQLPPPFEVTFDGNECIIAVPAELPAGKYSFVLKDLSGADMDFYLSLINEGHTFQDLLDMQSEPGEFYPQPYWTHHPTKLAQKWDESYGGTVYTFLLVEIGEYVSSVGRYDPDSNWYCAPFQIVEAPSE